MNSQYTYRKEKAPPSAYWDKAVLELKKVEDEEIKAQDYFEKALENIKEAREQL